MSDINEKVVATTPIETVGDLSIQQTLYAVNLASDPEYDYYNLTLSLYEGTSARLATTGPALVNLTVNFFGDSAAQVLASKPTSGSYDGEVVLEGSLGLGLSGEKVSPSSASVSLPIKLMMPGNDVVFEAALNKAEWQLNWNQNVRSIDASDAEWIVFGIGKIVIPLLQPAMFIAETRGWKWAYKPSTDLSVVVKVPKGGVLRARSTVRQIAWGPNYNAPTFTEQMAQTQEIASRPAVRLLVTVSPPAIMAGEQKAVTVSAVDSVTGKSITGSYTLGTSTAQLGSGAPAGPFEQSMPGSIIPDVTDIDYSNKAFVLKVVPRRFKSVNVLIADPPTGTAVAFDPSKDQLPLDHEVRVTIQPVDDTGQVVNQATVNVTNPITLPDDDPEPQPGQLNFNWKFHTKKIRGIPSRGIPPVVVYPSGVVTAKYFTPQPLIFGYPDQTT